MTIHYIFWSGLVLVSIMFWCFVRFFNPNPNMQTFKRAGSREAAARILDEWGPTGLTLAKRNLNFDWFFILVYSSTWIAGAMALGPRFDAMLKIPAMAFAAIGLGGALCDLIENFCLWSMLHGNASDIAPRLCKRIMNLNILFFFLAADYFVNGAIVGYLLSR
jgi:hypothetical protein